MINKATAHLHAAELLYQHQHHRDSVSRAYYAAFSAMYAFVGDPPRGRWEHPGLRGAFIGKLVDAVMARDALEIAREVLRVVKELAA